ncbi:MAG TPA: apolipoprotein N-acyltransferase [Pseudorhizobium sp.]|nr:apolipoprotein N-acyltransferase [Pseudorhizobium sp.]
MERLAGRIMLLWGMRRVVLALASGAVAALALPPFNVIAALFVSFPVLVWLMDGLASSPGSGRLSHLRPAFFLGWLFGLGYFVAGLWWVGNALLVEAEEFAWAIPLAVLGLPAFLAVFYGFATTLAAILWSDGLGRIAALAFGFGIAEWLRGFAATGFPWNAIGYGAMPMPMMMQSAGFIGVLGVTTLAVFVSSVPALFGTRRGLGPGLAAASCLLALHLGYGAYRLSIVEMVAEPDAPIVRLVQPVVDQARKLENSDRSAIFEEHLALSALPPQEGNDRPDIIVWPETSVPFILTENKDALSRIAEILQDGQVLVAGAVRVEYAASGNPPRFYNSAYVIGSDGEILGASDKVHLTPFGEYLPFEDWLRSWGVDNLVALPGGFSAAAVRSLLTLPDGTTIYPLICYEVIFPDEIGEDIKRATAILNITNDAWFGDTPGPYQHLQQARARAVEAGLPVIRGANSGVSAIIDPLGRIVSGLDFNVKGVVDAALPTSSVQAWDKSARNLHAWIIIIVMFLIASVARRGIKTTAN